MDVDRLALERALVAEDLHAVDQLADAVRLRTDELRQRAVAVGALALEKLRCAPDAGERVFDLVGKDGGKPGDRARGAAMGKLALDHLRHAALLEHDQDAAGYLRQRSAIEIDQLRRFETERAEVDGIFVDRGAVSLHLFDESDERAAEGDDVGEQALAQHARAHLEEIFGRGVGVVDPEAPADNEERMG